MSETKDIVSTDLAGWWHRVWLKMPSVNDDTSLVHWAQSDAIYVDLRIPATPLLAGVCAADLDDAGLLQALKAEGFAGQISVTDGVCTWRRDINWHGRSRLIDAGRIRFGEDGDLYEDGVHLDYAERWTKAASEPLVGKRVKAGALTGFISASEKNFAFGVGKPRAAPSDRLISDLRAGRRSDDLLLHFQSEYIVGHWDGGYGVIDLSTTPFRRGQVGLTKTESGAMTWQSQDMFGRTTEVPLR